MSALCYLFHHMCQAPATLSKGGGGHHKFDRIFFFIRSASKNKKKQSVGAALRFQFDRIFALHER